MKITGEQVQDVLFHFMQRVFRGDTPTRSRMKREIEVLSLFYEHDSLSADTVAAWPPETRAAAHAWFTRLLIFVSLFPDLDFPPDFLDGSSSAQLGRPVIVYILQYSDRLATLDPARRGA